MFHVKARSTWILKEELMKSGRRRKVINNDNPSKNVDTTPVTNLLSTFISTRQSQYTQMEVLVEYAHKCTSAEIHVNIIILSEV